MIEASRLFFWLTVAPHASSCQLLCIPVNNFEFAAFFPPPISPFFFAFICNLLGQELRRFRSRDPYCLFLYIQIFISFLFSTLLLSNVQKDWTYCGILFSFFPGGSGESFFFV